MTISIHALREEGDATYKHVRAAATIISIHALREEGDQRYICHSRRRKDFYPRPPRGGRRGVGRIPHETEQFLSTPSARRATAAAQCEGVSDCISIHALREEGDAEIHMS